MNKNTFIKRMVTALAATIAVSALTLTSFAASKYSTPVEAVAGLTGKTVEEVQTESYQNRKSFAAIASEAGVLDEFQKEMLEIRKDMLDQRVASGQLTREQADAMLNAMENNQAFCNGAGYGTGMMGNGGGYGMINGGCGFGGSYNNSGYNSGVSARGGMSMRRSFNN